MITILAYIYIAKTRILETLAYRFEFLSGALTNLIIMISTVFFWKVAFKGIDTVAGVDLGQMITYSTVTALLGTLFIFSVENKLHNRIRQGDIAVDFIKPINIFCLYFAQDVGTIVSSLVQKFIPLLLLVIIFIKVPVPKSIFHFIIFIISSIFSYFILWLLSAIVGVSAFWVINLGPLGFVKNVIVRILSGSVVPIWFFPDPLQNVIKYLPFVYTYQLPAGVYIGKIGLNESISLILIQMLWVVILSGLFYLMQKNARKRLMVQGG